MADPGPVASHLVAFTRSAPSPPGAGAVKGLVPQDFHDALAVRKLAGRKGCMPTQGARSKDLGTLDGSRGGLILRRRMTVTPQHEPVPYRALVLVPAVGGQCGLSARESDRSGPLTPLTRQLRIPGVVVIVRSPPWLIAR